MINVLALYLVLLKSTCTSFAGLASLPVVQHELVETRHVLTDSQLTEAVVITRSTPGPLGLYIVSIGYFAAGVPGAIVGWLAMVTPALLIIPLLVFARRKAEHPRFKTILQTVILASSGLLLAAAIPLGRDAITGNLTAAVAVATIALIVWTKIDTLWIILGAALCSVATSFVT
jgi:chromate transporter